ncbi:hypothetical protein ACJRO7_002505 [Eucalyptus globulus]|uniref:Uncharacterized protein n=1 Tax=Eucalyptus globulus TaxID=34317 RepID=A0ABD3LY69_EUCGL
MRIRIETETKEGTRTGNPKIPNYLPDALSFLRCVSFSFLIFALHYFIFEDDMPSHSSKFGPTRRLVSRARRIHPGLQGLDPVTVAAVFSTSEYMGEKKIGDTDCFVLKLSADQADLSDRSDSTAETIKHVAFGYFSQKNGLLVYLEDSYLTRIQSPGTRPMYWETSMATQIRDYREVDGVMIAHSGQSSAIITRFGDGRLRAGPEITRLEETWIIDDSHSMCLVCLWTASFHQRM